MGIAPFRIAVVPHHCGLSIVVDAAPFVDDFFGSVWDEKIEKGVSRRSVEVLAGRMGL
jgi:hypothetical protein